ncbi:hypothetical protein RNJ44_04101 [Nakaseomyces bracarensis]|uniref:MutL C-terminal dimerisation domain-containing protein n=1 Tax=Nakaseomyces bracarensis TaxID=273131 RepID=A0ABR4NTY4_9SACH
MPECVIRELTGQTRSVLRAETQITSVGSLLRELVQNAADADARQVKIVADVKNWRFMVSDDGCGLSPSNLNVLGRKTHVTSKIEKLDDLEFTAGGKFTYGFRGEALYSISKVSDLVAISKQQSYRAHFIRELAKDTPARIFALDEAKDDELFTLLWKYGNGVWDWESGTTILVSKFFENLPVRRATLNDTLRTSLMDIIREDLLQLLINNPKISIKVDVVNDFDELIPIFDYCGNLEQLSDGAGILYNAFTKVYGKVVPDTSLKKVRLNFKSYKVSGIISGDHVKTKEYQIIYFNGRRYKNKKIFSLIGDLVGSSTFSLSSYSTKEGKSARRNYRGYILFLLHVEGPISVQDLVQDTSKAISQLRDSNLVNSLIFKIMHSFLHSQGFLESPISQTINLSVPDPIVTMDSWCALNHEGIKRSPSPSYLINSNIKMANYGKRALDSLNLRSRKIQKSDVPISPKKFNLSNLYLGAPSTRRDFLLNPINEIDYGTTDTINFVIDRTILEAMEVIGQVDKKFILVKQNKKPMNIYMIDQHACDERIRLEHLLFEFINNALNKTLAIRKLFDVKIEIPNVEAHIFEKFSSEFMKWGIYYDIFTNEKEENYLLILALPDFLLNFGPILKLKEALLEHLFDLKDNKKSKLKDKKTVDNINGDNSWWSYTIAIPNFIRDYFNTKACRSSIMFGDALKREECIELIKRLSKCCQPYYCAHGRPSIVKILSEESYCIRNYKSNYQDYKW